MINCDKCGEWYHGKCLGLTKKDSQDLQSCTPVPSRRVASPPTGADRTCRLHAPPWSRVADVCPLCDWTKPLPTTAQRPALLDLAQWAQQSDTLRTVVQPDVALVKKLAAQLRAWQAEVARCMTEATAGDSATVRHFIRQSMVRAAGCAWSGGRLGRPLTASVRGA